IRAAEGRGSGDAAWFGSLPLVPADDAYAAEWAIRATTHRTFIDKALTPIESRTGRALNILDLGAGVGWLSNRLAERGHAVAGVDLSDDARDGLGAWRHYATRWSPVQAEFDALPFRDATCDLVVFNASLHYSTDIAATLHEALRVTKTSGQVVIIDTPVYRDRSSGTQMLAERAEGFEQRFGRRSDALPVEGFLTEDRLAALAASLHLRWTRHDPSLGLGWKLRPLRARLRGHREPARFPVLVAERAS
ncbi:MAG: class I SAM-dependent methyltransferase, partial [Candidatus Limnocylindrales bacterium]